MTSEHINVTGSNKEIFPVRYVADDGTEEDPILIVKLAKNQKIDVQCIVRKGTGKEHAKWSPVATVAVQQVPIIDMNRDIVATFTPEQKKAIADSCPTKVYNYDADKDVLDIENLGDCMQCKECEECVIEMGKNENAIKIGLEEDQFLFTVESTGSLAPEDIVSKAFTILINKLTSLEADIENAEAPMEY